MLLVILGAGASFDSVPSRPVGMAAPAGDPSEALRLEHRPPLADDLFASTRIYEAVQRKFDPLCEIVTHLQRRTEGETVEDVLARMQEDAKRYPYRRRHLMAVRLYILELLRLIEDAWLRKAALGTNHQALYDQIELHREGRGPHPLFVTFNYDRLLECALKPRGVVYNSLGEYIQEDRPHIFKLHGSVDWRRPFQVKPETLFGSTDGVWKYLIETATNDVALGDIQKENNLDRYHDGGVPLVPALALPYRGKIFECPDSHIESLKQVLPKVRGIMAIGWRAGEEHFLRLLAGSGLRQDLVVHAVCGSAAESGRTIETLQSLRYLGRAQWLPFVGGFSDYVRSKDLAQMLRATVAPRDG